MRPVLLIGSLVLLTIVRYASSATYSLSSSLSGQDFIDAFTWGTNTDSNYGRVNYVDLETAWSKGLVSVSGKQVTLRADSTTVLNASGPGRDSFDIVSKKQYGTHVAIFDISHMPEGCGTWPAGQFKWCLSQRCYSLGATNAFARELGPNWPNGGEIDILEGINNQSPDLITLHTGTGCTMPSDRAMTGTSKSTNCNVYETDNASCGVSVNAANSYGPSFNAAGGGWYAIERTSSFIKVWFWSRDSASVPAGVKNPGRTINTGSWGTPAAYFPSSNSCDFASHVGQLSIVVDLDFCGSWAGNANLYSAAGCPSTCADYVNNNPSAFRNAYFTFNVLTIYE